LVFDIIDDRRMEASHGDTQEGSPEAGQGAGR